MIPFVVLALAIGLFAWVFSVLIQANRGDAPTMRRHEDAESRVVHSGREVLRVVAITTAIVIVLIVIFCGTNMVNLRM
jgi:hypothetical protein